MPAAKGGTLLYDAVYAVAKDALAKETGRKAMVILSDGGDNGSRRSLAEAIEQAQRADVQVYSILYSMFKGLSGGNTGRPPKADPGLEALEKLSESTGGHVFTVSRTMSLREIFAQIADDLRLQYELGYSPPPDTQAEQLSQAGVEGERQEVDRAGPQRLFPATLELLRLRQRRCFGSYSEAIVRTGR